jgi:hypothetical protein
MEEPDETGRTGNGTGGETFRNRYDWSSTTPSMAVVQTVANALGRDHDTLGPLHRAVDPEALNEILICPPGRVGPGVSVSFSYMGCDVSVRTTGQVSVEPRGHGR